MSGTTIIIIILVIVFFPILAVAIGAYAIIILVPLFLIVYITTKLSSHQEGKEKAERASTLSQLFKVPFIAKVKNASGMEIFEGNNYGPFKMQRKMFSDASYGLEIWISYVHVDENPYGGATYYGRINDGKNIKWIILDNHVFVDASQDQINSIVKDYRNRNIKCDSSYLPFYDYNKVSNAINQIYPPKRFKGYNPKSVYNWIIVHNWGETSITAPNEETALRNFSRTYPNCRVMSVNKEVK